jgi:hypothetical protein
MLCTQGQLRAQMGALLFSILRSSCSFCSASGGFLLRYWLLVEHILITLVSNIQRSDEFYGASQDNP